MNDSKYYYLYYIAARLIECFRILKKTGSIYLHCDPTISPYLRILLDCIFGEKHFRNEIVWWYSWGLHVAKYWNRKHDVILMYVKDNDECFFDGNRVRVPYRKGSEMTTDIRYNKSFNELGKLPEDVFDIPSVNSNSKEKTGYPTQKPLALLDRIISASSNINDIVLDPFMGSGTTIISANNLNRKYIGIDKNKESIDIVKERIHNTISYSKSIMDG